jgi:diaminopimelate decarboxylase
MILTHIAGVAIPELVERFGTPTYVYDRAKIEQRIRDLKAFPVIRYAQKANSALAILDLMRRNGVLLDAVSAGEIYRALKVGYRPEQIVYTADVFDHPALDLVAKHRLPVNCGSSDMIRQFGQRCPGRNVTLRINPGFGHGHSQKTNTGGEQSKHGIWHEQLPECLQLAKDIRLNVTGIHMHIGSGTDLEHLSHVCGALVKAAELVGPGLQSISAGGGLPIPYRPTDKPLDVPAYTQLWMKTKQTLETDHGRKVELEVEPGRYLVADAGYLVAEIRAVKRQGKNTFYLLNAGFNNLARPILYGAYHPMSICPIGREEKETQAVIVGGPLCESGDIFTQAEGGFVETRELPKARVGDFLTIHCAGAYSFVMGSNYNSMPFAAEVLISDGKPYVIRERQSLDSLIRDERIPSD